jgi:cell division septal protein FtsQ
MIQGTYERKISRGKFALAFVLTSFIFLIGLLVGYTLTAERTGYLEEVAYKQKLD